MQPAVIKYSSAAEYFFREGCYINELSNRTEDEALSIAQARVQPDEIKGWPTPQGASGPGMGLAIRQENR